MLAVIFLCVDHPWSQAKAHRDTAGFAIYALRYAPDSLYPSKNVFEHPPQGQRQVPFAWLAYLITEGDRNILIDTGFNDAHYSRVYHTSHLTPITDLLARLNLRPGDITDVVLTHGHVDHAGNIGLFPKAKFFVQNRELTAMLRMPLLRHQWDRIQKNRIRIFKRSQQVASDIRVFRIGGHTAGSCAVEVRRPHARILFPGDNCYLEQNCRDKRYVGSVANRRENAAFIDAYAAYQGILLTHHDPAVALRAQEAAKDVFLVYKE